MDNGDYYENGHLGKFVHAVFSRRDMIFHPDDARRNFYARARGTTDQGVRDYVALRI